MAQRAGTQRAGRLGSISGTTWVVDQGNRKPKCSGAFGIVFVLVSFEAVSKCPGLTPGSMLRISPMSVQETMGQ